LYVELLAAAACTDFFDDRAGRRNPFP